MGISIGRTAFIAGLAAALFGLFLLVAPRLTASSEITPTTAAATTTVPTTTGTTVVAPTTTLAPVTTTTVAATTSTTLPVGWDPAGMTPANGYDGTVSIAAAATGPLGDKESVIITDGDTVTWQVHVVNTTDGRLWGVFAWVEGFGRAYCDDRRLEPFAETDCWATGRAYAGETTVVAWANAWTEETQVKAAVRYDLAVAG